MTVKKVFCAVAMLVSFHFLQAYAATVVVKPGKFDHFSLEIPPKTLAGESFSIRAQIYDFHNNLITNFAESGKEFKVVVSGSATVQPSHLGSHSFPGGGTSITVTATKAEKIVFSIYEAGGSVPVITKDIHVSPNRLNHFVVQVPATVTAGNSFEVRAIAKDLHDNTVVDTEMTGKTVKIISPGKLPIKTLDPSPVFRNGTATLGIVCEKAGTLSLEIQETTTGSKGKSQDFVVQPAELSSFKIVSVKEAVAGEPFEITVSAFDSFGNPLATYGSSGSGVELRSSGQGKIDPSFIKPSEFKQHEAVVQVRYEKAEEISLTAKEQKKAAEGKSAGIKIKPARADHFIVSTPEAAYAGQSFKIKVEAYDRFNNIDTNYHLSGTDVSLQTTGTGALRPAIIRPSEFVNGIASLDVAYDKAESFSITAVVPSDKLPDKITIREQKLAAPGQKEAVRPPLKQLLKKAEKEETPKIKKTERETAEKPVKKTETKKEAVKEGKKESVTKDVRTESRKEAEKKATQTEPRKEFPGKEAATEAKKEPVIKEARLEQKKEVVKREAARPYAVENISIIEAQEKAMVVINTGALDGQLEYREEIESRQGKEWLKIRVKPAVRKTDKTIKFKSAFVSGVVIEEDKGEDNVLLISLELVPARVSYDIARIKNSLIVTVAKP